MRLDTPSGLLLLAALPIAALFLLRRLRRRERPLAAYFLLRDLVDALPLLSRTHLLRRRLQAALFLAALACAGLAAGGPVLGSAQDPPQRAVILLDHLAPWRDAQGQAGAWGRLTEAAAEAAGSLRRDDRVLVVRSDTGVVGGGLLAPRPAAALIREQGLSARPAPAAAARDLLDVLARAHGPAFVGIFTAVPGRWEPLIAGRGPAWRVVPVAGAPARPNRALLDVEVRPDLLRAGRVALFCRAGSFGPAGSGAEELALTVEHEGRPLARRTFTLAAGQTRVEVFPSLEAGAGLLRVALAPRDAFPGDDVFFAPLRERVAVPTLLVTEENRPLEAALRALPGLELVVSRPGGAAGAGAAVVRVYDAVAPAETAGNLIVIAPPGGLPGIGYRGDAPAPGVVQADGAHFLLEGVSLEGLEVRRLLLYEIPTGMEILATADGHPLIAAGRAPGGARLALLAFDPRESDWVHDPSFPILVANLASWLAEGAEAGGASFRVGEALPTALARAVRGLTDPEGRPVPQPQTGWEGFRLTLPGRWRIEGEGPASSGEIFVNLLDEAVSAAAGGGEAVTVPQARPVPPRPFRLAAGAPLLVAAVLLLILERFVAPPSRAGRLR